ncbi:MAG TPA: hypothetical protein VLH40_05285 [Atribacteraceae bacterium]|nr:hypothetical protein [Atribacteraceae bacterium]
MRKNLWSLGFLLAFLLLFTGCRWFAGNPLFPTAKFVIYSNILREDGSEVATNSLGILSVKDIENVSEIETSTSLITTTRIYDIQVEGFQYRIVEIRDPDNGELIDIRAIPYPLDHQQTGTSVTTEEITQMITADSTITRINMFYARSARFNFTPINNVGAMIVWADIEYRDHGGNRIDALNRFRYMYLLIPGTANVEALTGGTAVSYVLEIFDRTVENYFLTHRIRHGQAIITFYGTDNAGNPVSYKSAVNISAFPTITM